MQNPTNQIKDHGSHQKTDVHATEMIKEIGAGIWDEVLRSRQRIRKWLEQEQLGTVKAYLSLLREGKTELYGRPTTFEMAPHFLAPIEIAEDDMKAVGFIYIVLLIDGWHQFNRYLSGQLGADQDEHDREIELLLTKLEAFKEDNKALNNHIGASNQVILRYREKTKALSLRDGKPTREDMYDVLDETKMINYFSAAHSLIHSFANLLFTQCHPVLLIFDQILTLSL